MVLLVVACGNDVNDYRDADADAVAILARPIPSGRVSRRAAGWIAIALGLGATLIAATLGPALGVFALFAVGLSVAYSYVLKEIPLVGNLSVGVLCGAILVYGALAAGSVTLAVALSCAMTCLFVFAQEIFYTVEDAPGDYASGVRTTATAFGVAMRFAIQGARRALHRRRGLALVPGARLEWLSLRRDDLHDPPDGRDRGAAERNVDRDDDRARLAPDVAGVALEHRDGRASEVGRCR